MADVFFVTNRAPIVDGSNLPVDFGPAFNPLGLTFGKAIVANPAADTVTPHQPFPLSDLTGATFSDGLRAQITGGTAKHMLISAHGFDYTFEESILRLANLVVWFGDHRCPTPIAPTIVGICWPSLGELDPIDYEEDYKRAGQSGDAFRVFFQAMLSIMADFRAADPTRGITLLAHSMGNHALAAGLNAAIGTGIGQYDPMGKAPLFDEIILAASDEDTDALSRADKLGWTGRISRRVHLYYNNQDLALGDAARALHLAGRLGVDGPHDKPAYRGSNYSFVNCSAARPYKADGELVDPEWHQYYHLVPEVRDDICAMMSGLADNQAVNRTYRTAENYYRLDLGQPSTLYGYLPNRQGYTSSARR